MSPPQRLFRPSLAAVIGALAIGLLPVASAAQDTTLAPEKAVPRNRGDLTVSYAKVVKLAAPAVVNVYVVQQARRKRSPFSDDPSSGVFSARVPIIQAAGRRAR